MDLFDELAAYDQKPDAAKEETGSEIALIPGPEVKKGFLVKEPNVHGSPRRIDKITYLMRGRS
jgi:hypothetical protein